MKIAYLGPAGTFTHNAALRVLEKEKFRGAELVPYSDIADILYAVEEEEFDYGVVPIENSIEGSVNTSIDILINEVDLKIVYEIILNISHNLIASENIVFPKRVFSHPQALAQCRLFLKEHYPDIEKISTRSTIQSLENIKDLPQENIAIAPLSSIQGTNLKILFEDIGDYKMNQTRFYLLSKKNEKPDSVEKSSISFELKIDRPGGLLEIMELFKNKGINLTKIESRPAKHQLGKYIFIIDCEADLSAQDNQSIMKNIEDQSSRFKLLGTFGRII